MSKYLRNKYIFSYLDIENDKEEISDKESEYLPSEYEQSSSDDNDDNNDDVTDKFLQRQVKSNTTISSKSSLDASQMNVSTAICDENLHVEISDRKIIKQNYCLFCSKLQTQLARHLETVHRNEPDVKKFAVLPKNNLERKKNYWYDKKNWQFQI